MSCLPLCLCQATEQRGTCGQTREVERSLEGSERERQRGKAAASLGQFCPELVLQSRLLATLLAGTDLQVEKRALFATDSTRLMVTGQQSTGAVAAAALALP